MRKHNKKTNSYTIREIDSIKMSVKGLCVIFIGLVALTPFLLKYGKQGRLIFLWSLVIFGFILNIVHLLILNNRRNAILLDINSDGITLSANGKEKHFEWDTIEYIHLRYDEDSKKIQPFFYVKPIVGSEVGIPLGYFMEIPSIHARRIKRVVFEYTGRSDLIKDEYPPYWELVIMPWRIVKRYKKRKEENGK